MKRRILILLLVLSILSIPAGCGKKGQTNTNTATPTEALKPTEAVEPTKAAGNTGQPENGVLPTIDSLTLGEDYRDLAADLTFLTSGTDLADTKLTGNVAEFRKLYPDINITYEAVENYEEDMSARLAMDDWGEICIIPASVSQEDASNLFLSYGNYDQLSQNYHFLENYSYQGKVYGMASAGIAQGVLYNKKVFAEAGITLLPKTPSEYLDALRKIKDNTNAVPLYTNFADGWTMGAWDNYIGGTATGDPDFKNIRLPHTRKPFQSGAKETGAYAVYHILYEAVSQGLIEEDPIATGWEASKAMLGRGEIGTMVLGSWAYAEVIAAGGLPEEVGYMPFPITVEGKQYSTAGPDSMYGININASSNDKIAAMIYIKWLTEKSGFAYSEYSIPIVKGDEKPEVFSLFREVELIADRPPAEGEETLLLEISSASGVGIYQENTHVQRIVEAAFDRSETMEEIAADWNKQWTAAQEDLGVIAE
jgi:raffinose/stachyose/melibiose transport system substrate-binding protein